MRRESGGRDIIYRPGQGAEQRGVVAQPPYRGLVMRGEGIGIGRPHDDGAKAVGAGNRRGRAGARLKLFALRKGISLAIEVLR